MNKFFAILSAFYLLFSTLQWVLVIASVNPYSKAKITIAGWRIALDLLALSYFVYFFGGLLFNW